MCENGWKIVFFIFTVIEILSQPKNYLKNINLHMLYTWQQWLEACFTT